MVTRISNVGVFSSRSCWDVGNVAAAAEPTGPGRPLEIYFIDVQGGAATLLVTPERESVLIDSGWPGFDDRDPKRIVHVLKDLAGCDQLDHLVTTHWHMDHLRRRRRTGQADDDRPFLGPRASRGSRCRARLSRRAQARRSAGIAYRAASAGKRKRCKPGDSLPLKGVKALVLASGGQVIDAATAASRRERPGADAANPAVRQCSARPARRHFRQCPQPGVPVLAGQVSVLRRRRPHLERREEARLPDRPDRAGRSVPGDASWDGHLEPSDPGQDDRAHGRHHEQRPAQRGIAGHGQAAQVDPVDPGGLPAPQQRRHGDDDNTDPSLIANKDAVGGEFIRVRVTADGSKFTVQIGEHGPERTFESR